MSHPGAAPPPSSPDDASTILTVAPGEGSQRLDRFLSLRWPGGVSRGEAQRWIDGGHVLVDGRPAKAAHKLAPGTRVTVTPPPPPATTARPDPSIQFPVLHEDEWLLVLDKPAGLVVHPARGHLDGTLVNGLIAREGFSLADLAPDAPPADDETGDDEDSSPTPHEQHLRPGIVHRLDKDTSGVMVVAKRERAREGLKSLFERHDIERSYLALTVGSPRPGALSSLHGRHPRDRLRFSTHVTSGKSATTHVEVIEPLGPAALVRCTLETGRTHQIRVHLTELAGTPLLGDPLYGKPPRDPRLAALARGLGRQALHAAVLGFVHPITGERLRFETAPPDDFQHALAALRALA